MTLHDLLNRLDKKEPKPPKDCGKGWSGTKPPGCKRAKPKGKTRAKTVKGILGSGNPKNAIVKSGLSDRRTVLSTLKGHQTELRRIGALANEAIANQKAVDDAGSAVKEFKKAISEIKELGKETDDIIRQVKGDRLEELNNSLTGKIGRVSAKTAGLHKRIFETINPRKLVRVPKGTSQADYYAIMQAISQGDKKAIAQYTVKKPPKAKKTKPRKDSINFDRFDSRDRVHLHKLLSLLNHEDATPCGKGWSGTKPPGCKRSGGSSKAKPESKPKDPKPCGKGWEGTNPPGCKRIKSTGSSTKKPKQTEPPEPPKQSERSPLPKNHTVSSDPRITADTIDKLFDELDTPGASDRINALREILNKQGIQAVFNDKSSKKGNKNKAMFDQVEQPLKELLTPQWKEAIAKVKATVEDLESKGDPRANQYKKYLAKKEREAISSFVGIHAKSNGYTMREARHIVVATDSSIGRKKFEIDPYMLKLSVTNAISSHGNKKKAWSMSEHSKAWDEYDTGASITYLHESGHQVQYVAESTGKLKMTVQAAKTKFKSLTEYSEKNDKEWFAEHFTAWTLDADTYRKFDPDAADYIESAVKLAQKAKRRIP